MSEASATATASHRRRPLFAMIRDAIFLMPRDRQPPNDVAFTYFIQAGDQGPIKIGSTKSLGVRLRTLVTMSPLPLRLVGVMQGDHEARGHTRLAEFRIHGEWFVPSATVMEFIRAHAATFHAERLCEAKPPDCYGES